MSADEFLVHDVSDFPIVWSRNAAIVPGYAPQWVREMDGLLTRGLPFVVVFDEGITEEDHEDRKVRALWLKKNKGLLVSLCRSVFVIEPNAIKRAALMAQALVASKAFGVSMDIVASRQEAETAARLRLMQRSATEGGLV